METCTAAGGSARAMKRMPSALLRSRCETVCQKLTQPPGSMLYSSISDFSRPLGPSPMAIVIFEPLASAATPAIPCSSINHRSTAGGFLAGADAVLGGGCAACDPGGGGRMHPGRSNNDNASRLLIRFSMALLREEGKTLADAQANPLGERA